MLEARNIHHRWSGSSTPTLDGVSLQVAPGEVVGVRAPSGRGKSTLARLLAGHLPLQRGEVLLDGQALQPLRWGRPHPVQLVLQNAELAFNPRVKLRDAFPHGVDGTVLETLGARHEWLTRYPHELSGGELQRLSIARAFVPGLRVLIADELTAMHDAITQAQIWHALLGLMRRSGLGIIAISHDEALLKAIGARMQPI